MGRRVGVGAGTLVLDSEGLVKAAAGDPAVRRHLDQARLRGMRVVASAVTLAEVLRGHPRDAPVHRVLSKITKLPVSPECASRAGGLLGLTRMNGPVHAIDSIVAAAALDQERPVVVLTSDPDDIRRLTEEPDKPKHERVVVFPV